MSFTTFMVISSTSSLGCRFFRRSSYILVAISFVVGYYKSTSPPKPFAEPDWKHFANMMMICCGMFPRFPGFGLMSGMSNGLSPSFETPSKVVVLTQKVNPTTPDSSSHNMWC
jgi:hypothetical protein